MTMGLGPIVCAGKQTSARVAAVAFLPLWKAYWSRPSDHNKVEMRPAGSAAAIMDFIQGL